MTTTGETFAIKGRGSVPMPGVHWELPLALRVGQVVELRRPDGTRTPPMIRGIEHLTPNPKRVTPLLFGLPKSDFPTGTEIWTLD